MDIKIEAPGHKNQQALIEYYTEKLENKYGGYDFIKAIDVKVKSEPQNKFNVALQIKPERGNMIFASDTDKSENKALSEAIRKMNAQIEKYKQQHYHDVHTINKEEWLSDEDKTE